MFNLLASRVRVAAAGGADDRSNDAVATVTAAVNAAVAAANLQRDAAAPADATLATAVAAIIAAAAVFAVTDDQTL